ncbi:class I SAM-dependent methyltransferase [Pendulispora brunnea]|uniref:S-adenosyl-L-methionine-dependent methyltransferase n=1 Tax=Pendulispora brunnea TaxID=2905690 RepID=A0ABZ2KNT4_9BACT
METGRPSETARLAAVMRAAHRLLDHPPWIFEDGFAAPLAGIDDEATLRASVSAFREELTRRFSSDCAHALMRHIRADVTLRARYVEDELEKAMQRGVAQYVILGSGLDSFAYRRPDLVGKLHIFEVDHPATQARKQARLRELGTALPAHVTFVPVDFERQSMRERLCESGYREDVPAFFSWLGVTWYLTEDAIVATLKEVAHAASGSEIVLDCALPKSLLDQGQREILAMLGSLTATHGEPVRTEFQPVRMVALLREVGFSQVQDLGAHDINALYAKARIDGLRFPGLLHLLKATL